MRSTRIGMILVATTILSTLTMFSNPRTALALDVDVSVTIHRITALDDHDEGPDLNGGADFYAVVTIDGQEFDNKDSPDQDAFEGNNDITPDWEFTKPVDASLGSINVNIRIFDEDGFLRGDDDESDIDPGSERDLDLSVSLAPCTVSGELTGGCAVTLETSGSNTDNDSSTLQFIIVVTEPPSSPGNNVSCIHAPIWPQPGDTVTITATALDGVAAPKVADTIEIWVNQQSAAVATGSGTTLTFTTAAINDPTFSYGCRIVDNGVPIFTGWRVVSVGPPDGSSAVPLIFTGSRGSSIDIAFVPDRDSYSAADDTDFATDVQTAINVYYGEIEFLEHQDQINFWISQDMGDADNDDGSSCELDTPDNWDDDYAFVDSGAIIHTDGFRDCAQPDDRIFSSDFVTPRTFIHETGHSPFGLADEYCCDGGYFQNDPFPDLYEELDDCEADPDRGGSTCRQFTEDVPWWFDSEWFTFDPDSNDLMVDRMKAQLMDERRMNWMFDNCASASC
ncbi:MAG TPA: hypothetical protein VGQ13_01190 [Nitrososphaera sp.]|nr:hypothetical protein [Nitrososphaera sp.]